MMFAFQHPLDAVHFCHLAQLVLLYTNWRGLDAHYPELFGPEERTPSGRLLFAGPRVTMAVHVTSDYQYVDRFVDHRYFNQS